MHGTGTYRFASGRTFEGNFENGVLVRDLNEDLNSGEDTADSADDAA